MPYNRMLFFSSGFGAGFILTSAIPFCYSVIHLAVKDQYIVVNIMLLIRPASSTITHERQVNCWTNKCNLTCNNSDDKQFDMGIPVKNVNVNSMSLLPNIIELKCVKHVISLTFYHICLGS